MTRPKEANRAEAIVRGVGALIMVLVLAIMLFALPQILKGKGTGQMMDTMLQMIVGFPVLGLVVGVVGLIVWIKVLKKRRRIETGKREPDRTQRAKLFQNSLSLLRSHSSVLILGLSVVC